ncbi:MAG: LolA family protein [Casimicrobiaceae bacterium]
MSIDRRRLIVSIGALAAGRFTGLPRVRAATAFDLAQLMKTLATVRAGEASFVERRKVAMLDRTLESSGRLSFRAPDTFVRETLEPRRERIAVTGNTLSLTQDGRTRTMELDAAPEAGVVVEAIRGTLTGNRDALERHFTASVTGTIAHWSLELVPRDARLRGEVASVRVRGEQASVHEVVVVLADGDRSVMTIEAAATASAKSTPDAGKPSPPAGATP